MAYDPEFPPIPVINPPRPPRRPRSPAPPPEDPQPSDERPPDPPPPDPEPPDEPSADSGEPFPDSPPEEEPDEGGGDEDGGDEDGGDEDGGDDSPGERAKEALDRMEEAAARGDQARQDAQDAAAAGAAAAAQQQVGRAAAQQARDAGRDARDARRAALNLPLAQLAGPPAKGLWRTGVGEPVDPLTGAWLYEHTDAIIDTAAPRLSVRRQYASQLFRRGYFGLGWDTWLDTAVRLLATGTAYVATGDGSGGFFGPPSAAGGAFVAPDHLEGTRLTRAGAGWQLADPDGWTRTLDAAGRLSRVTSPEGTGITVRRSGDGGVTALEHDDGPRLSIRTVAPGLVTEVRDDLGRRWSYSYDAGGRLLAVRGPAGRTWRYRYSDSADPRAQGAVVELRDPAGNIAVLNTYETAGPWRGRVVEQSAYGDRWTFRYAAPVPVPAPTVANRNRISLTVVVTDPTGTQITHQFGATGRLLATSVPTAAGPAVTRWTWATSGQLARIVRPRGDRVLLTWVLRGASWRCTRIAQRAGSLSTATTFAFDDAGQLVSFVDATGARTDFERDAAGRLLRVRGPEAPVAGGPPARAVTTYAYDARGRLVRREDPDGSVLEQSYVAAGPGVGMVSRIAHNGAEVGSFDYDQAGRLLRVRAPDGTSAAQEWDQDDQVLAEVDPTGARREYTYDARGAVTRVRQQMLDEAGAEQPRAWMTTDVVCDAKGRITRTTTRTTAGTATSSLRYDGLDRVVETQGPAGLRTTYVYDARGLVTERRDAAGTPQESIHWWEHEIGGQAVTYIAPGGHQWIAAVDGLGRPAAITRPDGVADIVTVDQLGRAVQLRTRDSTGSIAAQERVTFDPSGQVAATGIRVIQDPEQPRPWANARLEYDSARRLVRSIDPAGGVTRFSWGANGLNAVTDAAGNAVQYEHDAAGLVSAVVTLAPGPGGPAAVRMSAEHDGLGRLIAEQDALGNRSEYRYDGLSRQVLVTDPAGVTARIDYDDVGAVARTRITSGPAVAETTLVNDLDGSVVSITDPDGARYTMRRDALGRVVALTGPAPTMIWSTNYDTSGRASTMTTAAGWTASLQYDTIGRLVRASTASGPDTVVETWEYDALGHITRARTPNHDVRSRWDSLGRCLSQSLDGVAVLLGWDPAGPLRRVELPDGTRVDYQRDAAGQLTQATTTRAGSPPLRTGVAWWTAARPGRITTSVGANDTTTDYLYDRAGRLVRWSVTGPRGGIEQLTLLPDARGLPAVTHRQGHQVTSAEADGLLQLTSWWAQPAGPAPDLTPWLDGGGGDQTALDARAAALRPVGAPDWSVSLTPGQDRTRLTAAGVVSLWQADQAHRYLQAGGRALTYDVGGRLTGWNGYTFSYDHRDRLVRIEDVAGMLVLARTFDGCGRPVTWTTPAGTRRSVLLGLEVLGEETAGSALRYAPGLGIDQPAAVHDGTGWRLLHRDHTWSVLATSTITGQVVDRASWGPDGTLTALTANFGAAAAPGAHLRFQGRPEVGVGELGAVDYRHRVLLTDLARFTAPDPVGPAGGLNPYVFAGNNPLVFLDPTGEVAFLAPMLAGAILGGGLAIVTNWDKNGWDFAVAVAAGAAGGAVAAIPGLGALGFAAGGALTGALTGGYQGYKQAGANGALVNGGVNAVIGGISGYVGGAAGARVATGVTGFFTAAAGTSGLGGVIGGTSSRLLSQYAGAAVGGAVGGFTGGFTGGTLQSVFSADFANAEGVAAVQVALANGLHQGMDGAGWGAVGGVATKALMQVVWLATPNPEGGAGLNKVLGFEGEFQAQGDVGAGKSRFQTPGGKRPDIWNARRWWSGKRVFGDAKNTNEIPSLNARNRQLRDMLNNVPNLFDPANPAAGGNRFTIFHSPGIKLPGPASEIGNLAVQGVIELVPLRQFVFGAASENDHIC